MKGWRRFGLVAAVLTILPCGPAGAWGVVGHAIVADIAERHLVPEAAAAVRSLLAVEGHDRLDQIASWADEWVVLHPETGRWHYVDIPLTAATYDAARDCPQGECVVAALTRYSAVLADSSLPAEQRLEALKFVVHLVGDIHQPLHCANNNDQGGNRVPVSYFGQTVNDRGGPLNLHGVWDFAMIERHLGIAGPPHGRVEEMRRAAAQVAETWDDQTIDADDGAAEDPASWANETHAVAGAIAYQDIATSADPVEVGERYDSRAWPVVNRQLILAGIRLASVLNRELTSPQ
jgi:hypothetical protein